MDWLKNINFTDDEILLINFTDDFFRKIDLESFARANENGLLKREYSILPYIFINYRIGHFNEIMRVTINRTIREDQKNARLYEIENLKYPPNKISDKLYYNRASFKKQSMFYGGFGYLETLFENKPENGDLITISTWRQKENKPICYAPIFHDKRIQENANLFREEWEYFQNQIEKLDSRTADTIFKIYSLITYFFIRPVKPESKIEYIFSAYFANRIFETPNIPKVEAILYPSVPTKYVSCNLAILPEAFDDKFDFVKAEEHQIIYKSFNKNQWGAEKRAETIKVEDNRLIWREELVK
jgi:hypothetical protein